MPNAPVELHVVSDATGETAARLVQALEAQFPEQDFVEIRHPRVEWVSATSDEKRPHSSHALLNDV